MTTNILMVIAIIATLVSALVVIGGFLKDSLKK